MKLIKKISLFLVIMVVGLIGLIQFPKIFISKKIAYKSFNIYSNEHIELTKSVESILDSVLINLERSRFKKEKDYYELYFVKGTLYEKIIRLFGMKNIASSKYEKHIYSAKPFFEKGVLKKSDNEYEWLNLVQIISHECIHTQMYDDYSTFGIMQTPSWINEGYCEYISYRPIQEKGNYTLSDLVSKLEGNNDSWIRTEYNTMTPRQYVKDRLIIEFLIDVKGMEITEIISDESINPDKVYNDIKRYYNVK